MYESESIVYLPSVQDFSGGQGYIAAMGPLSSTTVDFWRMLWHYNVHVSHQEQPVYLLETLNTSALRAMTLMHVNAHTLLVNMQMATCVDYTTDCEPANTGVGHTSLTGKEVVLGIRTHSTLCWRVVIDVVIACWG